MAAEELLELIGREKHRMRITGQLVDEDGAGINGATLTTKTVTIYDVDSDTMILDHAAPGVSGLTIDGTGNYSFWITATQMSIIRGDSKAGSYERHRVLMQFSNGTATMDFNVEFDVLVRRVKHLA